MYIESGWVFCGATQITPNWALTAAHCVTDYVNGTIYKSKQTAIAGGNRNRTAFTADNIKLIPQKDIIVHPRWAGTTTAINTVGIILQLTSNLNSCIFDNYIQ